MRIRFPKSTRSWRRLAPSRMHMTSYIHLASNMIDIMLTQMYQHLETWKHLTWGRCAHLGQVDLSSHHHLYQYHHSRRSRVLVEGRLAWVGHHNLLPMIWWLQHLPQQIPIWDRLANNHSNMRCSLSRSYLSNHRETLAISHSCQQCPIMLFNNNSNRCAKRHPNHGVLYRDLPNPPTDIYL